MYGLVFHVLGGMPLSLELLFYFLTNGTTLHLRVEVMCIHYTDWNYGKVDEWLLSVC